MGLAEFQGGWVSNHPPPQGGVGLCGGPWVYRATSVKDLVFCIACLSWVRGWVGGWVGVRPPPPGGGGDICRSVGMPKFWVGGSLNYPPPPLGWLSKTLGPCHQLFHQPSADHTLLASLMSEHRSRYVLWWM